MEQQRAAGSERRQRADARRSRDAVVRAAAELLRSARPLTMLAVADGAGVSRSTLYRHFPDAAAIQRALQEDALAAARVAIGRSLAGGKPPLAQLRTIVAALVAIGAELPVDVPTGPPPEDAGTALGPLAVRLAAAAGLHPPPGGAWLRNATAHFVEACLRAGWSSADDPGPTVEALLGAVAEPLDRGLVLLDADGVVIAVNDEGVDALDSAQPITVGRRTVIRHGGFYEDGAAAPPEAHPVTAALASGEAQHGIRAKPTPGRPLRWLAIEVQPLRRPSTGRLYGFVVVLIDVSQEKRLEHAHLRPPGELGAATAPLLDVVRVLDEVPPPMLPDQLVAEASRLAGGPTALYVLDIDGSRLLRLAGREDFPPWLRAPLSVGPELAEDELPDLAAQLARELPGVVMAPMWLRGRAVGILLALRGSQSGLREVARLGAAAMELATGYTDVFDAARRRKDMTPAAEIQQSLLPPRIVRMGSGELAGMVLPSYEVGGDWFDYVENRDGAWMAIADAAGKGPQAGGLGGVALAALRAARRSDASLEEALQTMHDTVCDVGGPEFFLTAIVARWSSVYSVFSWINCGHPPPLLVRSDDTVEELATAPDLPLGIFDRRRTFHRHQRRLHDGDRLVLYSDGVSRRRTNDGVFGTEGIAKAAAAAKRHSAAATTRAIQEAIVSASEDPLPDDAAVVVLAPHSAPLARG
jgi:AcrR family transcriptional regulator